MKTINAGSFFLLVFICFFEMMKPLCSPPLRLSLPFFFLLFSLVLRSLFFSSTLFPSLSISYLFFLCFPPVLLFSLPPLFSSFPHGSSLFFCVFLSLLPPVSIVSLSVFFLFICLSPLLSIYPSVFPYCHLSSLISFLLLCSAPPLAFIARGRRRFW
jgi:hypothetical protein